MHIAALSRIGGRKQNEDACGYWSSRNGQAACYVLADGAGGHGAGDIAAQLSVQTVLREFERDPCVSGDSVAQLLQGANNAVLAAQSGEQRLADMRSTIVVLQIDALHSMAFWGHVGDSRLYCFAANELVVRTKDHSLAQHLLDAGLAQPDSATASRHQHVLTGSLGGDDSFTPTVQELPLAITRDHVFLLCSDGFWNVISERQMLDSLRAADSPEDWLARMEHTLAPRLSAQADNYSAIAIWMQQ